MRLFGYTIVKTVDLNAGDQEVMCRKAIRSKVIGNLLAMNDRLVRVKCSWCGRQVRGAETPKGVTDPI